MKRLLVTLSLLICSLSAMLAQFSGSGSGTENDPYLIFYAEQLSQLRNFLNKPDVYFKLMSDIDLTEWIEENSPVQGWQPIGVEKTPFKGIFDGNGHTIENLKINRPNSDYIGLFGCANQAKFYNFKLKGDIEGHDKVGAIAGNAIECSFERITVEAKVKGHTSVGGGIGYNASGSLKQCDISSGLVEGIGETGGLIGYNQAGVLSVTDFVKCKVQANVEGEKFTGGLVGKLSYGKFAECYVNNNIKGTDCVGGFIGGITDTYYDNPKNRSFEDGQADIDSCAYYGEIRGNNNVGGFIGGVDTGDNNLNQYSCCREMNVRNSYVVADINASGERIGGLIGDCRLGEADWTGGDIANSSYSGSIQGKSNVGGLIGKIWMWTGWEPDLTIQKCFANGSVKGDSIVGGLVGSFSIFYIGTSEHHTGKDITIKASVAAQDIISSKDESIGRIYGRTTGSYTYIGELGTAEGNLALSTMKVSISGVMQEINDDEQNGMSLGQRGLKLKANYVAHGWDFNKDWAIEETETYPYKPWQTAPPYLTSAPTSKDTNIEGKSVDGGTVYFRIGNDYKGSVKCDGNDFSSTVRTLQSGELIRLHAISDGKWPSANTNAYVSFPGKGTETDPYLVYTAADLQGVYKRGYYKMMNDIDLTEWINANSPSEGWQSIGRNGVSDIYFNGDDHAVSGLWCNTDEDYKGLFSNFPGGYIRNLTVRTAEGKSVKGGNYSGILIGRIINGTIKNVTVEGKVESSSANANLDKIPEL